MKYLNLGMAELQVIFFPYLQLFQCLMAKGRGLWSPYSVPRLSERNIKGIRYRKSEFEIFGRTCGTFNDIQSIKCTYQVSV